MSAYKIRGSAAKDIQQLQLCDELIEAANRLIKEDLERARRFEEEIERKMDEEVAAGAEFEEQLQILRKQIAPQKIGPRYLVNYDEAVGVLKRTSAIRKRELAPLSHETLEIFKCEVRSVLRHGEKREANIRRQQNGELPGARSKKKAKAAASNEDGEVKLEESFEKAADGKSKARTLEAMPEESLEEASEGRSDAEDTDAEVKHEDPESWNSDEPEESELQRLPRSRVQRLKTKG